MITKVTRIMILESFGIKILVMTIEVEKLCLSDIRGPVREINDHLFVATICGSVIDHRTSPEKGRCSNLGVANRVISSWSCV